MGENDIHGAIFIVGGAIGTILAFKAESMPGEWQEWFTKHGRKMKILGPVVMLFGVAILLGLLDGP